MSLDRGPPPEARLSSVSTAALDTMIRLWWKSRQGRCDPQDLFMPGLALRGKSSSPFTPERLPTLDIGR